MVLFYYILPLVLIVTLLYILNFIVKILLYNQSDNETLSAYECGFEPLYKNARIKYSIIYWFIGILYLIFDLELILLLPFAIYFDYTTNISILTYYFFLLILIIGFIYEYKSGTLD